MKTLICLQGRLGFDEKTYTKGQKFDVVEDDMAEHLLMHRLATEVIPKPEPIKSEPNVQEVTRPEDPDMSAMVDLSELSIKDVLDVIEGNDKPEVLEAFMEAERAGKNRKRIIEALESKLSAQ